MTIKYRLEKQSTRSFVARKTTVILVTICINVIKKKKHLKISNFLIRTWILFWCEEQLCLFYKYFHDKFGKFISTIKWCTRLVARSHHFTVGTATCNHKIYANSLPPNTSYLWKLLAFQYLNFWRPLSNIYLLSNSFIVLSSSGFFFSS